MRTRGRRVVARIHCWVAAVYFVCSVLSAAAEPLSGGAVSMNGLDVARAAHEDGLFDLAAEQARQWLQSVAAGTETSLVAEAVDIWCQSLDALGRAADIAAAIESIPRSLRREPAVASRVMYWGAVSMYTQGDPEAALAALDVFEERDVARARQPDAQRLRVWCYAALGNLDQAQQHWNELEATHPARRHAAKERLQWGQRLAELQAYDLLQDLTARFADMDGDPDALGSGWLYLLALMDWHNGRDEDARVRLTEMLREPERLLPLQTAAGRLLRGRVQARLDRADAAEADYRQVMKMAVPAAYIRDAAFELGWLLIETGRVEDALPVLKTQIAEVPGDERAWKMQLRLADALYASGAYAQAVEEYRHFMESFKEPDGLAQAYHGLGWSLLQLTRNAEAATAFEKAAGLFASREAQAESWFKMADAYFANGQYRMSAEGYRRVARDYAETSTAPQALLQWAVSLAARNQLDESDALFAEVESRFAELELAAEARLRRADIKAAHEAWSEAIAQYTYLLETYPESALRPQALYGRGIAYHRLFRFDAALADFEQIWRTYPGSTVAEQAFYMRGMCHYWVGNDEKALAICREFLERFPDSQWIPDVFFWLARYEFNQVVRRGNDAGSYAAAEALFAEFARRFPAHSLADDALLWAGRAAMNEQHYVRAIEYLAALVKTYPDSEKRADARLYQATALMDLANFSEAILLLDELLTRPGGERLHAVAWLRKGDCQFTLGGENAQRYSESIESYRNALEQPSLSPELRLQAYYKIGRSLERIGEVDTAFQTYYEQVVVRYFSEREKGVWHDDGSRIWFTRAAFNAADIMAARKEWRKEVGVLERVARADVAGAEEARERIRRRRAEFWWLFY